MKKTICILLSILTCCALLVGCGGAAKEEAMASDTYSVSYDDAAEYEVMTEENGIAGSVADLGGSGAAAGLKMVYRATLDIETLDFDQSYDTILQTVRDFGGYVSNQYTSGGHRISGNYYNSRYAELTLRIPAERYTEFLQQGDAFGNVTSISNEGDDITAQYIDVEARLTSLKAQEERLLSMLDRAGTLEELISLEDHLADVRYEIESYTSTFNTYKDLISYSTVTIYLNEVTRTTNTRDTFGARLKEALSDSLQGFVDLLQNIAIFLIVALPYLLIALGIYIAVRTIIRKRRTARIKRAIDAGLLDPIAENMQPTDPENGIEE